MGLDRGYLGVLSGPTKSTVYPNELFLDLESMWLFLSIGGPCLRRLLTIPRLFGVSVLGPLVVGNSHIKQWPVGLCLEALGRGFTYFWGPGPPPLGGSKK